MMNNSIIDIVEGPGKFPGSEFYIRFAITGDSSEKELSPLKPLGCKGR